MREDLKNSGTLKLCYLLFEILNSISEDLNICYVKGMVLTRAIKTVFFVYCSIAEVKLKFK